MSNKLWKKGNGMNDELTKQDIEKMRAELDYRRLELMPELIEEVKRTRAFFSAIIH